MTMGNFFSEDQIRISPSELTSKASHRVAHGVTESAELAWTPKSADSKCSEANMETKTQAMTVLQGYLCTREGIFRVQTKRWYFVQDGQIRMKRNQRASQSTVVPLCDLHLCQVAYLPDARMFRITPPVPPGLVFQAPSQRHAKMWKDGLTEYISRGLARQGLQKVPEPVIDLIRENPVCADCSIANPEWVSLNLGILVCSRCAAVHNTLGPHVSKVRSLLSDWNCLTPSLLELLHRLGNNRLNQVWEGWINELRSNNYSGRHHREHWIQSKYVFRFFIKHEILLDPKDPGCRLYEAASAGNLLEMAKAFAAGANTRWIDEEGNNALHAATTLGSIPCIQFLLCNGSDIWATNNSGETATDLAEPNSVIAQLLGHEQSLVAPRVLIPVVDSNAKDKPFTSVEGVVPRRYFSDDTADTSDDKNEETEEILEDSSASDKSTTERQPE